MLFRNRIDGGKQLARALTTHKNAKETIVLGLPRGGVVTAYEVATALNLPLDVVCPIKIGAPTNKEYAIGAVTETGEGIFNESEIRRLSISKSYLKNAIDHAVLEAKERVKLFKETIHPLNYAKKTLIIVDDGMATGLTMKASIIALRKMSASKIIVAVPLAPKDTLEEIKTIADEVICLQSPPSFHAVGQFYDYFGQTSTEDVRKLLQARNELLHPL
ncbi:MAG: phosphoribosyltransferase family protein [Chlamydiales bacterium]|nr:phosphoribosyltransferase family protein [Chlamydiales bacterium]